MMKRTFGDLPRTIAIVNKKKEKEVITRESMTATGVTGRKGGPVGGWHCAC